MNKKKSNSPPPRRRAGSEELAATADILKALARATSDPQPVFDAIVRHAHRLCGGVYSILYRFDGKHMDVAAAKHATSAAQRRGLGVARAIYPAPPRRDHIVGRVILEGRALQSADLSRDPRFPGNRAPTPSAALRAYQARPRAVLVVPLLGSGTVIGAISAGRAELKPFTRQEAALLETFADQAVIAIENARLFNETKESLEQQTALGEVLRIVSRTMTDPRPAFDAILGVVLRLFPSFDATVWLVRDEHLVPVARGGPTVGRTLGQRVPVTRDYFHGCVLLDRRPYSIDDVAVSKALSEVSRADLLSRERRAILMVPLVRRGEAIGAISVSRAEPFPFSPRQVALLGNFADQAVIAIENARLFNETKEALEQQTATSEILKVISSSHTDLQPVFETIIRNAVRVGGADLGSLIEVEGEKLHVAAHSNLSPDSEKLFRSGFPQPLSRDSAYGRAILDLQVAAVEDFEAAAPSAAALERARAIGIRSALAVPLVRGGVALGAIAIGRKHPGEFEPAYVSLVKTFADQAVIAIENVRLFNETKTSLEQQTAISDVLRVIANSPADISPVLDAVAQRAARLCEADDVRLCVRDGDVFRAVAGRGGLEDTAVPLKGSIIGWVAERKTPLQLDVASVTGEEFAFARHMYREHGHRVVLAAPLLREEEVLGVIIMRRKEARLFTEQQIGLLKTFADQAAIAIENVRLFNETKEALERQTATAEILKVISSSPTDTRPVFDTILRSAMQLCEAHLGILNLYDGTDFRTVAQRGGSAEFAQWVFERGPFKPDGGPAFQALAERRAVQVADAMETQAYRKGRPSLKKFVDFGGVRTFLAVPLIREGEIIGNIGIYRPEVRPFTDKQIALVSLFASQAVIAIENVRLFNETKEALDQQTAMSDILRAISSSPSDLQPVFETILSHSVSLCEGSRAVLWQHDGKVLRLAAHKNGNPEGIAYLREHPLEPGRYNATPQAALERRTIHVVDAFAEPNYRPLIPPGALPGSAPTPTVLAVPLLREEDVLGVITIWRHERRPFTEKQIAMVNTFASQAVIAIENVRLFNETKEALEQQKASAEVLRVISNSVADTEPVFEVILRSCEQLFAGLIVGINTVGDDGKVHIAAYHGQGREELERHFPVPLSEASGSGAAIVRRAVVHYPDVDAADVPEYARRGARIAGSKSVIFAPMLWEDRAIGAIFVGRDFAGPFSEKDIALLKTFADQAVIAIQNARLFREIQEKSAQLEIANKHKSDFLANMSHELRTPLNAIIGFSEVLSERMFGEVNEKQAEYLNDIHESGRHLLSLINDILDLSKIEAGRMELELSSFHLPSAVSNAMTLVRERAQRHGIALASAIDPAVGEFEGDERKVKQILLNLLSNAVKFTPDGGRVDVAAKKVDGRIEIEVHDTGIGIAPEDHAAVFEEFKQVGRDYTRKAEGTGLGLALTKRLVELHGGEIALASAPGKGSTFTVRLPLR